MHEEGVDGETTKQKSSESLSFDAMPLNEQIQQSSWS